ncbi:hypothetical protein ACEPAI_7729 [Sanghuangporus weigelae]
MSAPPSLKDIEAVYQTTEPKLIHVNHAAVRIRDGGSDGDESRLPEAGEQVVLWDNTINVLEEADAETVRHWLGKIGNYLIHEGRGQWHNLREDRVYFLKRFPPGYKLYTRSTGPRDNPRKDSYLYGSTTDRCREFRSPEEFVYHVKWMAFEDHKERYLLYSERRPAIFRTNLQTEHPAAGMQLQDPMRQKVRLWPRITLILMKERGLIEFF